MRQSEFIGFPDRVLAHAEAGPARTAVVCDDKALTYGELANRARACAARLQTLDFAAGGDRRVGVIASNSLDFAIVILACQIAGVTIVPLPKLIAPDAQARMIDDANIAILFYDDEHGDKTATAIGLSRLGSRLAAIRISVLPEAASDGHTPLDEWLAQETARFTPVVLDPDWPSDLIYSSGTTGVPKGIVQSYGGRAATCATLAALGFPAEGQFLHTIGLYSNFGISGFLLTLWWGGTFFTARKFAALAVVETLARNRIDMAWFAPATLVRTLDAPGFEAAVSGRPCAKLCAGAPLSEANKRTVLEVWPGAFWDLYGQTETGTLTILPIDQAPAAKRGSVGQPLPSVQVRIIDDNGQTVEVGVEGEIAGHSATLMSGYHQRPEANASAYWTDAEGRLYIRTGDVGKLDAEGYVWLCDRKKDMIISGGFNIYPADIERVLSEHPAVFESAVVGYPSARWGETPVAFVILRSGSEVDEEDLRIWANARLGSIQKLSALKLLDALPNGTMGKILKRELRQRYADQIGPLP